MLSTRWIGDLAHGGPLSTPPEAADLPALVHHGLAAETARLLRARPGEAPAELEARLGTLARQSVVAGMQVVATASRVADVLQQAGVDALVYKGPALAVLSVGEWSARSSVDVDVLVDARALAATHRALRAAGLRRADGVDGPPGRLTRYMECERSYRGLPSTIDLHWRVDSTPGYLDIAFPDLWARRTRVSHQGLEAWTPGPADALLITLVHGARSRWARLKWALDAVRQFERLVPEDWALARRLSERGARRALDLGLAVAEHCGAHALPEAPSAWARVLAARWLAEAVACAELSAEGLSPGAALGRRAERWHVADGLPTALDGLLRALLRQALGDQGKSVLWWRARGVTR